jgi:hypothetical protein
MVYIQMYLNFQIINVIQQKSMGKAGHACFWVVLFGSRGSQQYQLGGWRMPFSFFYQADADTLPLVCLIYREAGQIGAKNKIGKAARYAHQFTIYAGGYKKVGVPAHCLYAGPIVNGAALAQRAAFHYINIFCRIQRFFAPVNDFRYGHFNGFML